MVDANVLRAPGLSELLRVGTTPEGHSMIVEAKAVDGRIYALELLPNLVGPLVTAIIRNSKNLQTNPQFPDLPPAQLGFAKNAEGDMAVEVVVDQVRLILPVPPSALRGLLEQVSQAVVASDPAKHH